MSSTTNQYYAVLCVNLLSLAYGLSTGWTSSAIPYLQSPQTPLICGRISDNDASLIASILTVGGLAGTLFFGYALNEIGRKKSLVLVALPQIIGWIFMFFADNAWMLIVFRFLSGVAAGGIFTVAPIYISEIAEDRVRGVMGSLVVLFMGLGILLAYIFGAFLPYFIVPLVSIPFSFLFLIGFYDVPETPIYLLKTRMYKEAEDSLKYYRGVSRHTFEENLDIRIELDLLLAALSFGPSKDFSFKDLKMKQARKAILFGVCLMALNQLCGFFAMLNFTSKIFKVSGSTLSPEISSIIVGVLQIIGGLVCTFTVEKAGRKLLLAISAFGMAFGLAVLSLHTFAASRGFAFSHIPYVPLISFSFFIFIANLGVATLPFLYVSEIVPVKIKGFTMILCLSTLYIFATLVIEYLSTLIDVLGMHGTMLLFAINSLIGAIFIVFCLPETKGKSYEEISKLLG